MTEESPKASRPPLLNCELCDKQFGKPTKLERHLLEDHHAEFGISPGVLSPTPSAANFPSPSLISDLQQVLVKKALNNAVSEANRIFETAELNNLPHALCALCHSGHQKAFKNAKDLAQHILTKHNTDPSMDMDTAAATPAVLKTEPLPTSHTPPNPLSTRSEISSNPAKRKQEPLVSQPRPRKEVKKSRLLAIDMSADTAVAPAPNTSKNHHSNPAFNAKHESKPLDAAKPKQSANLQPLNDASKNHIPGKRPATDGSPNAKQPARKQRVEASPTVTLPDPASIQKSKPFRSSTTTSGTKPPITPKKAAKATASNPKAAAKQRVAAESSMHSDPINALPVCNAAPVATFPASVAVTTAPIDFTSIGGFTTNARKSYYRLSNR